MLVDWIRSPVPIKLELNSFSTLVYYIIICTRQPMRLDLLCIAAVVVTIINESRFQKPF